MIDSFEKRVKSLVKISENKVRCHRFKREDFRHLMESMRRLKHAEDCQNAVEDEDAGEDIKWAWKRVSRVISKEETKELLHPPRSSKREREFTLTLNETMESAVTKNAKDENASRGCGARRH